ncbi:hypothetical protein PLICRDRAFT_174279 [Plicaturopsis crispa FD-325 SS-3]|nr:hypothetical protein PLICRDRAFT_174279 [Plicaturopsis crispa FD-325 SS-3]
MTHVFDRIPPLNSPRRLRSDAERELTQLPFLNAVVIRTPDGLKRLGKLFEKSPAHADHIVWLTFRFSACSHPNRAIIRQVLERCVNLEVLSITVPSKLNTSFFGPITFPRLTTLETNISHTDVAQFIRQNPLLHTVTLGACDSEVPAICPLKQVPCGHLQTLSCPLACAPPFIGPMPLHTLTARRYDQFYDLPTLAGSVSFVLQSLPAGCWQTLTTLSLDLHPRDYDILFRVFLATPNIRNLKLTESQPVEDQRETLRRAWNNRRLWATEISQLRFLTMIRLRTKVNLVAQAGNRVHEGQMVKAWSHIQAPGHVTIPHPTLREITVWYLAVGSKGVLSTWTKRGGGWLRTGHTFVSLSSGDEINGYGFFD